jgi:hypothetical protein
MKDQRALRFALALPLIAGVSQLSCAGKARAQQPGTPVRVVSYCEYAGGSGCQPVDDAPAGTVFEEVSWCCDFETGDCVFVSSILACDPEMEFAVICEWGASVEQSSPIGSIDCYG